MADSVSSTCLRSSRDRNADTTEEERVRTTDATGPSSLATDLARNARELFRSAWLAAEPLMGGKAAETADAQQAAIVELVEKIRARQSGEISVSDDGGALRTAALELRRYQLLARLMRSDYDAYVATASFLSPGLISREDLPNIQDVPYLYAAERPANDTEPLALRDDFGQPLVPDCTVPAKEMGENPGEVLLLEITRNIYADETNQPRNKAKGILGLVEEMRLFMLSPRGSDPAEQQRVLLNTLYKLMTPVLPPFYRIFMAWRVPSLTAGDPAWLVDAAQALRLEPGKQYGPAFYAPFLTSVVAPFVFGFLVGPARVNLRSDGQPGGLVVNKCKFLQESNCKGMCLHSCKLPAQQLFEELGLPLRVIPNFDTQECQWSFGEATPDVWDDETWPKGCLAGCGTRQTMALMRRDAMEGGGVAAKVADCY